MNTSAIFATRSIKVSQDIRNVVHHINDDEFCPMDGCADGHFSMLMIDQQIYDALQSKVTSFNIYPGRDDYYATERGAWASLMGIVKASLDEGVNLLLMWWDEGVDGEDRYSHHDWFEKLHNRGEK